MLALTFPHNEAMTEISGVLSRNLFGGGYEMAVAGANLVFGTPDALKDFKMGDVLTLHGKVSPNQMSFHMSGTNYDVSAAELFNGTAVIKDRTPQDGPGDKIVLFRDGRETGAQG